MNVIYLDIDDEITSAASRIRAAPEGRVGLVLPAGSRVATSRINFRLLAREAQARDRRLAIIAPEASTRALAAAAGLPVFGSVAEYESSVDAGAPLVAGADVPMGATTALASAGVVAASAQPGGVAGTTGTADLTGPGGAEGIGQPGATPSVREDPRPRESGQDVPPAQNGASRSATRGMPTAAGVARRTDRRRRRVALAVIGLIVLFAGAAAGAAAYVVLPTASVVVVPRIEPVGPESFTVRADPAVATVDPAALEIPATRLSFDVEATGTFPATGQKIEETRARGTVVFQNCDTSGGRTIRAGTLLRTRDAVGFTTTASVTVPTAVVPSPGQITCPSRAVDIVAAKPGVAGNVAARTITVLPSSLDSNVLFVRNPAPTSGGARTESTVVSQKDVDEAQAALARDLADRFAELAADPAAAPPGSTVYPDTADLGEPTYTVDAAKLVGVEVASFDLGASATGEVTAVDPAPIQGIATDRIAAAVTPGFVLVPDSSVVEVADGVADGPVVTFAVAAAAKEVREVDLAAIRAEIRGRTVADAEEILAAYGDATITVWPDWATTITGLDFRLDVSVGAPADSASPSAGPSGPPVETLGPSPGGDSQSGEPTP